MDQSDVSTQPTGRATSVLPRRSVIIGTSGCGKTTLGRRISEIANCKCTDLDDLHWLPNWKERPDPEFIELVKQEVAGERWVISGNYSQARDLIWARAEMLIWLDLPISTCLWRALRRTLRRWYHREPCCNENYEPLSRLLTKYSILWWIWTTHAKRRRVYGELFANPPSGLEMVRLTSPAEVTAFLETHVPSNKLLYKVTTKALWEASGDTLQLAEMDTAFVHLAEEHDIERITTKFFTAESDVVILTLDPTQLIGHLVKERNPGGSREYYHLYEGSIPLRAVVASADYPRQ